MKGENAWRYHILAFCFAGVAILIVAQIIRLQFIPQAEDFKQKGLLYAKTLHIFYPARGQIYDRYGNLLAGNTQVYEVGADVAYVENAETIAFALSKVLVNHPEYNHPGYYNEVFTVIATADISGTAYVPLADFVTEDELTELKDWAQRYKNLPSGSYAGSDRPSLSGLVYRPRLQRSYPERELACNILGFVNREGVGVFGLEEKFNELLAGESEMVWLPLDPYQVADMPQVSPGTNLILTLDREIQAAVEGILDWGLVQSGAEAGVIVVMDPETGEILAMATTPRLDLNEYWKYGEVFPDPTPFNRAVSMDYEPGSVYKVLTMAAALDSGAVSPDTVFVDTGTIEVGGIYIHNWNYGAWGPQDMQGCLQHSLNVCLAWVSTELGAARFYEYMQKFGIGHLTGIELAGEVPGRLKLPGDTDWYEAELGTNSFGQGVAVTPVQMLMAVSAVANEGRMVAPHILRSLVRDGYQYNPIPPMVGMPISAETASTLTNLLTASLENESSDALVTGYRVAGKTGTAEIPGPLGYESTLTNASFVGWGPVDDPQFMVYVWLEKPTASPWGSVVAAPVFREVVEQLVVLMDIPPDDVRNRMASH